MDPLANLFAHGNDVFNLSSWMYTGDYLRQSVWDIAERFAMFYFVPLLALATLCLAIKLGLRGRVRFSLSTLLLVVAPPGLWLMLVYDDPSHKAMSNFMELSALGAIVGLCIGLNNRLTFPNVNAVTTTWAVCVVAMSLYLFVPAHPVMYAR